MSFMSSESFTVGGDFSASQQAAFGFIVENEDVVIKSIIPVSNYLIVGSPAEEYTGSPILTTSPIIRSLDTGRLFFSPVKNLDGGASAYQALLVPNIVNYLDVRLFAGQKIDLVMPFHITYKSGAVVDFDIEIYLGFLVSYEEVEFKSYGR